MNFSSRDPQGSKYCKTNLLNPPSKGAGRLFYILYPRLKILPSKNHQVSARRPKNNGKDNENLLYNTILDLQKFRKMVFLDNFSPL